MVNYLFREYKKKDYHQVIDMLSNIWKCSREKAELNFIWKYDRNPISKKVFRFVVLDNEKVIGFRGFFLNKIESNSESFESLSPSDMFIKKEFRRQGLFRKLTSYSMEEISKDNKVKFFLNLSSNQYSVPGYIKMGWKVLSGKKMVYSKSFSGLLEGKWLDKLMASPLRYFINLSDYYSFFLHSKSANGYIEITRSVKEKEMSKLSNLQTFNKFHIVKNIDYYSWRLNNPLEKYYNVYYRDNNSKINCFMTLKKGIYNDFIIVNYGFSHVSKFQELLKSFYSKIKINYIRTYGFFSDKDIKKVFMNSNFYSNSFLKKINPRYDNVSFLIRPVGDHHNSSSWIFDGKEIDYIQNWYLQPIDSDGV